MVRNILRRTRVLGLAVAVTLLAGPARAADIDRYLPADTEMVFTVNVRQILGSQLAKKAGLEQLRDLLRSQEEVDAVLKELGFDPLKDIDKVIAAGPGGGEQDKGLLIVHGRFNVEKFKARADKAAKDNKESLKVLKVKDGQGGEYTVYEIQVPGPQGMSQTLFVGFAGGTTLLAAPSKDYLVDGLKVKPDATKARLKNKAFQDVLSKLDEQQSFSIATVGEALTKGPLADLPIKDVLTKVTAVAGGVTLADGIKMEFTIGTKQAADARMISEKIGEGLNTALAFLALAAMNQKELAPALEIVKSLKTSSKDTTVSIKGEVSAEMLNKLLPRDQ